MFSSQSQERGKRHSRECCSSAPRERLSSTCRSTWVVVQDKFAPSDSTSISTKSSSSPWKLQSRLCSSFAGGARLQVPFMALFSHLAAHAPAEAVRSSLAPAVRRWVEEEVHLRLPCRFGTMMRFRSRVKTSSWRSKNGSHPMDVGRAQATARANPRQRLPNIGRFCME